MKKGVLLIICFVTVIVSGATIAPFPAGACSCAMPPPIAEDVERKTAVFSGKVLAIHQPGNAVVRSSADPVSVLFEVMEVWKGVETSQVAVQTAASGSSCGYENFEKGKEYLVFAYGSEDQLKTGLCERTNLLSAAGDDVAALGESYAPGKQVDLRAGFSMKRWGVVVVIVIVLAVTLWGIVAWRKARTRRGG